MHTEQPDKPSNGTGSIQEISLESAEAMVTLHWSPPKNYDSTTIDYYELTLIGTHSNTTTRVYVGTDQQQAFSHTLPVSERNYTSADISAVDVCGQRSEPSHFVLTNIVSLSDTSTAPTPTKCTIIISVLAAFIGLVLLIFLVLAIILGCIKLWQKI